MSPGLAMVIPIGVPSRIPAIVVNSSASTETRSISPLPAVDRVMVSRCLSVMFFPRTMGGGLHGACGSTRILSVRTEFLRILTRIEFVSRSAAAAMLIRELAWLPPRKGRVGLKALRRHRALRGRAAASRLEPPGAGTVPSVVVARCRALAAALVSRPAVLPQPWYWIRIREILVCREPHCAQVGEFQGAGTPAKCFPSCCMVLAGVAWRTCFFRWWSRARVWRPVYSLSTARIRLSVGTVPQEDTPVPGLYPTSCLH